MKKDSGGETGTDRGKRKEEGEMPRKRGELGGKGRDKGSGKSLKKRKGRERGMGKR